MLPENAPGACLKQIVEQNAAIVYDADKTMGLLSQACPEFPLEVQALVAAQRFSLPWELLNLGPMPTSSAIADLLSLIEGKMQTTDEATQWVLRTWAYALDIKLPDDGEPDPEVEEPQQEEVGKPVVQEQPQVIETNYFVIDGPNRWGPANVATLNQWATEGRLHGQMQFQGEASGRVFRSDEVPGLFIGTYGSVVGPKPFDGQSPYLRQGAANLAYDPAVARSIRVAFIVGFVAILFSCLFAIISIALASSAKNSMGRGDFQKARSLAKWATAVACVGIVVGSIYLTRVFGLW